MPSPGLSSSLLTALLLLAAVAASIQDARPDSAPNQAATTIRPPRVVPPAPNSAQFEPATFRKKVWYRECECLNGGACQRRTRRCQCPLGYDGAHCEEPDLELLVGAQEHDAPRPTRPQPTTSPSFRSDWLFYVPLATSILLLCVFALIAVTRLASSSSSGKSSDEKKRPLSDEAPTKAAASVYTLPLPVPPPPYSEKADLSSISVMQTLQQLAPEYFSTDSPLDEYAVIA